MPALIVERCKHVFVAAEIEATNEAAKVRIKPADLEVVACRVELPVSRSVFEFLDLPCIVGFGLVNRQEIQQAVVLEGALLEHLGDWFGGMVIGMALDRGSGRKLGKTFVAFIIRLRRVIILGRRPDVNEIPCPPVELECEGAAEYSAFVIGTTLRREFELETVVVVGVGPYLVVVNVYVVQPRLRRLVCFVYCVHVGMPSLSGAVPLVVERKKEPVVAQESGADPFVAPVAVVVVGPDTFRRQVLALADLGQSRYKEKE